MNSQSSHQPRHRAPHKLGEPQRPHLKTHPLWNFPLYGAAGLLAIILHSAFGIYAAPPPELTVLRQQYDKVIAERVTAPFEAGLVELNTKYSAGLDRAIADAKAAGNLEDIIAIEAETKRLADKLPIPTTDDDKEPESLKRFRGIYRQQFDTLTAARDKAQANLLPPYTAKLQTLEATLVKNDRVEEAKEVLAYRQALGVMTPAVPSPTVASAPTLPSPAAPMPEAPKVKGDDRKAAEWILANWSEHRLFVDSKLIKGAAELPKGKFSVTGFSLDGRFYTGTAPLNKTVLVENLGGLAEVRTMTLGSFPDLKDEDLAFIATLTELDELKLSKLACTDAFLGYLKGLKKLRKLDFGELANLTGTGFAQLAELSTLNSIIHWKGGMTDAGVAEIASLPSISTLDFQSSPAVTDSCIPSLRTMEKLTTLLLSATSITPEGFTDVVMPKIKTVGANELAKRPLSEIAPKMAVVFPNVESYAFSYFARTPEDLAVLAHYKKLKRLTVAGTIKDEAWPGLLELRELDVFQTYSGEIGLTAWQTLARLKKLKIVRYGNKPPNAAALAAFKKERPDVKLEE